jgi:hypothetical protein
VIVPDIPQIPSAFRLILAVFEPEELQVALTLFGLSGALANVMGLVIAGSVITIFRLLDTDRTSAYSASSPPVVKMLLGGGSSE